MAKSSKRKFAQAKRAARKESWKSMSPEAKAAWNEQRVRTAKTGYAKRQRERMNGKGMDPRTHESKPWHWGMGGLYAAAA